MKKAYTNQNIALVGAMRSYLEENEFACELRNEFSSSIMGEVAFFEVWPEVWVRDDEYARAVKLVEGIQKNLATGPDWSCRRCLESNPASFEVCWQCGQLKPATGAIPAN